MIRIAEEQDLPRILAIYNQAVAAKFQTADTEPVSLDDRKAWMRSHLDADYPVLLHVNDAGVVTGWLSISAYRPGRKALRGCVEISYYLDHSFLGQGIGSKLMERSLEVCKERGFTHVFAIILDRNDRSISLMKKFGFTQWAHMPDIAEFDGERCGHVYYGRAITI